MFLYGTFYRSILLGSKGFDLPRLSEKIDNLSTAKTFEPLEPIRDTDIQVLSYCQEFVYFISFAKGQGHCNSICQLSNPSCVDSLPNDWVSMCIERPLLRIKPM